MAISKKDAKEVIAVLRSNMTQAQMTHVLEDLKDARIKNKSFRKSIKRITKMLERKAAVKKAA